MQETQPVTPSPFRHLLSAAIVIVIMMCTFQNAYAQSQPDARSAPHSHSHFFLQPDDDQYSHFLFRLGEDGKPQRVFGLGVYTPRLHPRHMETYDPLRNWVPDDELMSSLRENITIFYNRYSPFGNEVRRPAILDSLHAHQAFELGGGHLAWWLRDRYATTESGWLSPDDQAGLADRIDREGFRRELENLANYAGDSEFIIDTFDEPEHGGYGDGWFFSRDTQRLMYEEATKFAPVALGLGPVADHRGRGVGSQLTWSIEHGHPGTDMPGSRALRRTSMRWEEVLYSMLDYYNGYFDIIHLNSYAFTIPDPRRIGEIVTKMLHHPSIDHKKPVWPWISAENFRYGVYIDETNTNIRAQAFSALANDASGLMFYPDVRIRGREGEYDERIWEYTYDLIKEINFWRPVLEQGERVQTGKSGDAEWIHFRYNGYDVVFLVNHGRKDAELDEPGSIQIEGGDSGVWVRQNGANVQGDGTFIRFRYPGNLSFHSVSSGRPNWWSFNSTEGETDLRIRREEGIAKSGEAVLRLTGSRGASTAAETTFDLLTGTELEAGIWFKSETSGSMESLSASDHHPVLTIEIWSDDERIQTFSSSSKTARGLYESDWVRLSAQTGTIPTHATHARLTIGTSGPGSWLLDDAFLRMRR